MGSARGSNAPWDGQIPDYDYVICMQPALHYSRTELNWNFLFLGCTRMTLDYGTMIDGADIVEYVSIYMVFYCSETTHCMP